MQNKSGQAQSEPAREEVRSSLEVEAFGRVPAMEFRQLHMGQVVFRYVVEDAAAHLGFDARWREMSETERRQTLRMGGRVAEWLKSLQTEGDL